MNLWVSLMQTVARSLQADLPANSKPNPGLELKVGEVVYGTLMEMVDSETAVLELKGQQVRAQTEAPLPFGARVPLLVVGPKQNGQLELKILPEDTRTVEQAAEPAEGIPASKEPRNIPQAVERLIQNLGFTPSNLLKDITAHFLQAKMTILPAALRAIETFVQQELTEYQALCKQQNVAPEPSHAGMITQKTIETAVWMLQKQIPLSPDTFQAMKTLRDGPNLQHLLAQADFPAELQAEVLAKFTLELEQLDKLAPEHRGMLLQETGKRMGLDHEARLAQTLLTQSDLNAFETDTLKSVLLKETLQNPAAKPVEQALYHMTGQQLMYSARDDQSPFFYQFLALPMFAGENAANADIHVLTRKKNGRQLDPDNCYLYFHLTMPELGELGIHVQVLDRLVSLRLIVQDEASFELPAAEISALRAGLEQAGFSLGTVRKEAGVPDDKAPFSQLPILLSGAGLDFRI